jgi:hypothetical protein
MSRSVLIIEAAVGGLEPATHLGAQSEATILTSRQEPTR